MMNTLKKVRDLWHYITFAAFMILQGITVFSLTMFGDDYYYSTFFRSSGYFISENIRHYKEVNGRCPVHLFDEILLLDKSLVLFGIFDIIAIGAAVFFAAAIAAGCHRDGFGTRRFRIALAVSCFAFATLDIEILRGTAYWATGALNYLFPVSSFLAVTYFILKYSVSGTLPRPVFLMLVPAVFLNSWSTEQAACATVAVVFYALIQQIITERKRGARAGASVFRYLALLCASAAGFCLLFFAPGNAERKTYYPDFYAMTIKDRVLSNVSPLFNYNIGENGYPFLFLIILLLLPLYLFLKHKENGNRRAAVFTCSVWGLSAASAALYSFLLATSSASKPLWLTASGCVSLSLLLILISAVIVLKHDRYSITAPFCALAAFLQAAMLLSPEIGGRTCLCSALLLTVPAADAVSSLTERLRPGRHASGIAAAVCAVFFSVFALLTSASVMNSYLANAKSYAATRENMDAFKTGAADSFIFVIPEKDRYRYKLPYDSKYDEYWYKTAYGLDTDTEIHYVFPER